MQATSIVWDFSPQIAMGGHMKYLHTRNTTCTSYSCTLIPTKKFMVYRCSYYAHFKSQQLTDGASCCGSQKESHTCHRCTGLLTHTSNLHCVTPALGVHLLLRLPTRTYQHPCDAYREPRVQTQALRSASPLPQLCPLTRTAQTLPLGEPTHTGHSYSSPRLPCLGLDARGGRPSRLPSAACSAGGPSCSVGGRGWYP